MAKRALGLIVNPLAGLGGRVGLKGSEEFGIFGDEQVVRLSATGEVPLPSGRPSESVRSTVSPFVSMTATWSVLAIAT